MNISAAMASSHAYALMNPDRWDKQRAFSRERFRKLYDYLPSERPQVETETDKDIDDRFRPLADGLKALGEILEKQRSDILVIMGDDQGEHFVDTVPQIAIYTGESFKVAVPGGQPRTFKCNRELARHVLASTIDAGFDVTELQKFEEDRLRSHAHTQVLDHFQLEMSVLPIFLNAIHPPAPTPARCFDFGKALRNALMSFPDETNAVLYASGGLSHFSGGYPYKDYGGSYVIGDICEDQDHKIIDALKTSGYDIINSLSSRDLLNTGEIEVRQWIALWGALEGAPPDWLHYGAFYRGTMGMGVAYWNGGDRPTA